MQYIVTLPVKPYVKKFLEINYGEPVALKENKDLNNMFRHYLKKPCKRWENKYLDLSTSYSSSVIILISEDDFYRYGWDISKTDTVAFNTEIQKRAKFMMRNLVNYYNSFLCLNDAIRFFQDKYGFTEDIWSFDAIKKDLNRNTKPEKIDFKKEITEKIEKIVLGNLSDLGTISHQIAKTYAGSK